MLSVLRVFKTEGKVMGIFGKCRSHVESFFVTEDIHNRRISKWPWTSKYYARIKFKGRIEIEKKNNIKCPNYRKVYLLNEW